MSQAVVLRSIWIVVENEDVQRGQWQAMNTDSWGCRRHLKRPVAGGRAQIDMDSWGERRRVKGLSLAVDLRSIWIVGDSEDVHR